MKKLMYNGVTISSLFAQKHKYNLCVKRYRQGMNMKDAIESVLNGVDNRKHNHRQLGILLQRKAYQRDI